MIRVVLRSSDHTYDEAALLGDFEPDQIDELCRQVSESDLVLPGHGADDFVARSFEVIRQIVVDGSRSGSPRAMLELIVWQDPPATPPPPEPPPAPPEPMSVREQIDRFGVELPGEPGVRL